MSTPLPVTILNVDPVGVAAPIALLKSGSVGSSR